MSRSLAPSPMGFVRGNVKPPAQFGKCVAFPLAAKDRVSNFSGQLATFNQQSIAARLIETEFGGIASMNCVKPPDTRQVCHVDAWSRSAYGRLASA